MKLSRIRIEQFKQFRRPVELTDLEPGINLFTGPNEAGKSTVVAAIRAAFFERHRSGSVDELRPWGDTSASPTVELEFVIGETSFRLMKSFLGRKRCELQVGTKQLDGAEAEEHLAELLGFRYAGRGASTNEHWGIPGLLWIEQGAAHDIKDSVKHATDHLRAALNQSIGEVASSGGDELISRVEAARNELLTAAAGKPRGPYAAAIERQAGLEQSVRQLDADVAAYREKVDRLAMLRRDHAHDEAERPWLGFRKQQQAAEKKLEEIERVEQKLAEEKQRTSQVESRITLLRKQLETFAGEEKAVQIRATAEEAAAGASAAAAVQVEQWQSKRGEAENSHRTVREALRIARQEGTRKRLAEQLQDIFATLEQARVSLALAEAEQATLLALQQQAAASEIKPEHLETLREQHRQLRELQIRQDTAATRLRFALDEGRELRIGAEPVSGTGERLLLETATLMLPGLGTIDIVPGGTDLSELRRQEAELSDSQAALLQRLGLPSLDAAEARFQLHAQRLADIKTATAKLKALAPKGVDALRTEQATQQARAGEIDAALNRLPSAPDQANGLPSVIEAEAAEAAAAGMLETTNQGLQEARLAAASAESAWEAATRELTAARALVEAPERAARIAAMSRDVVDAKAEQAALAERVAALAGQIGAARPDILKQDVERFRKSAEQHEKSFNERREALIRLEAELQSAGAQGLEERRAELVRDLDQAHRRTEELRRRAEASDYLLKLLQAKRRVLTQRLQAPLQNHLNRYLQLLFPDARLELDENLSPGPLTRTLDNGTESGDFEALSFGAREQMGVISRLAYADLLLEAGRPTLVILDDALVHTDEERLAQMKRVLFDAATRHQVLLFTCHPEKWRDMGVNPRSLDAARGGG